MVDRDWIRHTLQKLVQIDSVNPMLVPGAAGEAEIAAYVAGSLRGMGLEVEMFEPEPGRVSVVGRLRGTGGGKSLMLNAHLDTVGVAGMAEPFSGELREGRIYGRGAFDMKGSLAAGMAAAHSLAGSGLRGDLVIAAVADEEYGSLGTRDLIERMALVDGAVVTEPTALEVCLAHKGYLWIEVKVTGRAAHGSRFELGLDANLKMGKFLAELDGLEKELRSRTPHPLVGPPSLHAALLEGGSGLSTYAATSRVQIERRSVPGETEAQAVAEIQGIVDRLAGADPDFHATVNCFFARGAFEVSPDSAIVQCLDRAAAKVRGVEPKHVGDTPWMDAALLAAAGIETVICGATGTGAHADVEWVELESVVKLAEILAETASLYCA
jgi:acetylornithine deacetylase